MLTIITNVERLRIKKVDLKLVSFSNNLATVGNLYSGDELICHTFELPDKNNAVNVSCIPAGEYKIKPIVSPKFGSTYKVFDVNGRTDILIHTGNTVHDTLGCIMPCDSFGFIEGKYAGLSSRKAYVKLMALLDGGKHTLTIKRY